MVRRTLVGLLIGTLVGAGLSAGAFLVLATLDGTRSEEAVAYSFLVAVIGGFLGSIVGAVVGLGNMRVIGGALVGLVLSLVIVAMYMSSFAGEGTFMTLLNRSRPIIAFTTVPLMMTGMAAAWIKNRYLRSRDGGS